MDKSADNNIFIEWLTTLGPGFIIGLAMGYFIKKSFKIFLFFFGAAAILGLALGTTDIIDFNLDSLKPLAEMGKNSMIWFVDLAEDGLGKMAGQGATALAGLALGIKMG